MYKILFAILILCVTGCNPKHTNLTTLEINPEFVQNGQINMTSIVNSVEYIQLSSEKLLGRIYFVKGTNDYVFTCSTDGTIHVFDYKGNYVKNISQVGKGPGEIGIYVDFAIDSVDHTIFVLDSRSIKAFSFENKFINEISIENNVGRKGIACYKNRIFLFKNFSMGQLDNTWEVYDKDGNKISEKRNSMGSFESNLIASRHSYFYKNNNLYYWNALNDTIFQVNENTCSLGYLFSQGEYRVTKEELSSFEKFMNSDVANLEGVYSSGNYLLFKYVFLKDRKKLIGHYNTNNGNYQVGHMTSLDSDDFGYFNDWDGGMAFAPEYQIAYEDSGETLVSVINAFQLKEFVATEAFKTSTPKYPEKKRELEKLANSLNENDNPVLMLVKLKE